MTRAILAALAATTATLILAPAAMATAQIDITCVENVVKVDVYYQQFSSGPPASSHTSVRVDGGVRVDEVVSFDGPTFHKAFNYSDLGDGRPHTIEAKHQWIDRPTRTVVETATMVCGTIPPAPSVPAPEQSVAPVPAPVAVAPAAPVASVPARHAARRVHERKRRAHERRRHGSVRHRTTRHHRPRSTG